MLTEALGLLTLGLVSPWGEVLPQWVPVLGGRRVPPVLVVAVATAGGLAVCLFTGASAWMWTGPENNGDPEAPNGLAGAVMTAAYAPLLLWGPALLAVTADFACRHRRPQAGPRVVQHRAA
ncbi:hypothetical protein [Motilibacter peucedani]|uniref:hypothetical protein n=1 Tax=Motilibacter peucedani TaxID=598650 RepID=UPI0011C37F03|nr:hypothetical protein [Motilibacter peucedani]